MKRLVIVIAGLLSMPSIAFSQRGAWTTEKGQSTAMIMSDAERDSIEWSEVNGVLGAEDIATTILYQPLEICFWPGEPEIIIPYSEAKPFICKEAAKAAGL